MCLSNMAVAAAWLPLLPSGNGGPERGGEGSEHQHVHFCLNLEGILNAVKPGTYSNFERVCSSSWLVCFVWIYKWDNDQIK